MPSSTILAFFAYDLDFEPIIIHSYRNVLDQPAQGIAEKSGTLIVEAMSLDGIVEGIRPVGGERVLAVQWHPEWRVVAENAESQKLFAWFGILLRGASFEEAADRVARVPGS